MQIGPRALARALEVKSRIDAVTGEVQKQDDVTGVDLDSRPGEISMSLDAQRLAGKDGLRIPVPGGAFAQYKDEVQTARLSYDPATKTVSTATVDCAQYYDSSYGRSAEDMLRYAVDTRDGVRVYTQKRDVFYNDNNSIETIRVDAKTGNVLSYQAKEYAETFPQALKDVFTSFAGIALVATAGLLCGAPGTLGGVLFGPIGGVVGAGATALGLAYYKTRPSHPSLPRASE